MDPSLRQQVAGGPSVHKHKQLIHTSHWLNVSVKFSFFFILTHINMNTKPLGSVAELQGEAPKPHLHKHYLFSHFISHHSSRHETLFTQREKEHLPANTPKDPNIAPKTPTVKISIVFLMSSGWTDLTVLDDSIHNRGVNRLPASHFWWHGRHDWALIYLLTHWNKSCDDNNLHWSECSEIDARPGTANPLSYICLLLFYPHFIGIKCFSLSKSIILYVLMDYFFFWLGFNMQSNLLREIQLF